MQAWCKRHLWSRASPPVLRNNNIRPYASRKTDAFRPNMHMGLQQQHHHHQQHAAATVLKPASDQRTYRSILLDNGMRALLIHDQQLTFAAACANVQCGYMLDPREQPGLAHWLEHAVHLGSEHYPGTATYKKFLAQHGGSSNAATSMLHTRYHFRVHHEALPEALDRFAALVAAPTLDPAAALQELDNVHAEYSRNCNSDDRRLLQVRRSFGTAPYSSFSTGSWSSLRDEPLAAGRQPAAALQGLWQQLYTAGNTCVAVISCHDLDQQETWIRSSFSQLRPGTAAAMDLPGSPQQTALLQHDTAATGRTVGALDGQSSQLVTEPCEEDAGQLGQQPEATTNHGVSPAAAGVAHSAGTAPSMGQTSVAGSLLASLPADGYAPGSLGRLVCLAPMRELRQLQLMWHLPFGIHTYSRSKPWSWAAHLLGHEAPGSAAYLLKAQGLIQDLSAGLGEELRAAGGGRGWATFSITCSLTPAGEQVVSHIVGTLQRAVTLLRECSQDVRQSSWQEAAQLAAVRWYWRDTVEPVEAVQSAALALHYHPVDQLLSGPVLMQEYDASSIQVLLDCLVPSNLLLLYTSPRWRGNTSSKEPWYGGEYSSEPIPAVLLQAMEQYSAVDGSATPTSTQPSSSKPSAEPSSSWPMSTSLLGWPGQPGQGQQQQLSDAQLQQLTPLPGQLHLPSPNWALPTTLLPQLPLTDLSNPTQQPQQPQQEVQQPQEQEHTQPCHQQQQPGVASTGTASGSGPSSTPVVLLEVPGLCCWHRTDTSFQLPKVYVKLHLVTPAAYACPAAAVASRLLTRVLEEQLLPDTYHASRAGSSYSLSVGSSGLLLTVAGFTEVVPELLQRVLGALSVLTLQQVVQHLPTQVTRLQQQLTNWAKSNPIELAEYELDHLLQQQHHHVNDLLAALPAVTAADVLAMAQQMHGSGTSSSTDSVGVSAGQTGRGTLGGAGAAGAPLHIDMLVYGAAGPEEATGLAWMVREQLAPAGLQPEQWPQPGVLPVSPQLQQDCSQQQASWLQLLQRSAPPLDASRAAPHTDGELADSAAAGNPGAHSSCSTAGAALAGSTAVGDATGAGEEGAAGQQAASATGPTGASWRYQPPNPNPSNSNNAVVCLRQLGPSSIQLHVMMDLLVALAAKPAFHALRTQQRLGYTVRLRSHTLPGALLQGSSRVEASHADAAHTAEDQAAEASQQQGDGQRQPGGTTAPAGMQGQGVAAEAGQEVLGLLLAVQSPSTPCGVVQARLEEWLQSYQEQLMQLSPEDFVHQLQVLQAKYLEPPKCLRSAAARVWRPIKERTPQGTLDFQRHQQLAALAADGSLDKQQFVAWYVGSVLAACPQLAVHITGGKTRCKVADGSTAA